MLFITHSVQRSTVVPCKTTNTQVHTHIKTEISYRPIIVDIFRLGPFLGKQIAPAAVEL